MRGAYWLFLSTLAVWAAACTSPPLSQPSPSPTLASPPAQSPTPTLTLTASPTNTPTPTATATAQSALQSAPSLCSPLADHEIEKLPQFVSNPYNPPVTSNKELRHHGVDFAYFQRDGERASIGDTSVTAILPGRVASALHDRLPYGNMVIIETPYAQLPADLVAFLQIETGTSLYHLYAHMRDTPLVSLGDNVICGQQVGNVGDSGFSFDQAHLHLETRLGPAGAVFPSMVFYDTTATQEQMDAYVLWRTSGQFVHFDPMSLFTEYYRP